MLDLVLGPRRNPIDHHSKRGRPLLSQTEILPRHGVRVSSSRGHKQPQIGSTEQLRGQVVVGHLDRVDIGRVQDRETRSELIGSHQPQPNRANRRRTRRPRQASEHTIGILEPRKVLGVAHQHRRTGRRSQHTRRRDIYPDEAVRDRRLSSAGRSAEHREQRRVQTSQPRQEIVIDLVDDLGAFASSLFTAGKVE